MSFFGTDGAEKKASKVLSQQPTLDSTKPVERQAKSLTAFFAQEDDLTFKESSVKNISDRGRTRVIDALVEALGVAAAAGEADARRKQRAAAAASESAPAVSAAPQSPPWVLEEVKTLLRSLLHIRTRGRAADILSAANPLTQLAALPIDSNVLKRTKVALELNNDFWKKSDVPEIKNMVAVLVREWKNMFRNEKGAAAARKPRVFSARVLRNAATDLEESVHSKSPRVAQYQELIKAVIERLGQAPEQGLRFLDGAETSLALVTRAHNFCQAQLNASRVKRQKVS
uniref:TFIIS N-terminal domain-containing protein n=1 Tax=Pfiesteria piscicida TaxID=71001 RepID=A3E3Q5_PFIPI|nr:unknown [Pfiesteria piscicida]